MSLIFSTQTAAESLVQRIDSRRGYPLQGRNALTGELVEGNWTYTWGVPVKHPSEDLWAVDVAGAETDVAAIKSAALARIAASAPEAYDAVISVTEDVELTSDWFPDPEIRDPEL